MYVCDVDCLLFISTHHVKHCSVIVNSFQWLFSHIFEYENLAIIYIIKTSQGGSGA